MYFIFELLALISFIICLPIPPSFSTETRTRKMVSLYFLEYFSYLHSILRLNFFLSDRSYHSIAPFHLFVLPLPAVLGVIANA